MSLSVLRGIRHKRIKYAPQTFPRAASLQDHLKNNLKDRQEFNEKGQTILRDPVIIVCGSSGSFETFDYIGKIITETLHEPESPSFVELDDKVPIVVICVLQSKVGGSLSIEIEEKLVESTFFKIARKKQVMVKALYQTMYKIFRQEFENSEKSKKVTIVAYGHQLLPRYLKDKQLLESISGLPTELVEHLLFVMDKACNIDILNTLSDEIQLILRNSRTNRVYHSLFQPKSSELQIRLSIYLETNICNLALLAGIKIDEMWKTVKKTKNTFQTEYNANAYADILLNGPLEKTACLQILLPASENYVSTTVDRYTRNKWTVDGVKKKIAKHICKELGNHIIQTLLDKYKSELNAPDSRVAAILFEQIDLSDIRQDLYLFILNQLFSFIIGAVIGVVEVVRIFVFSEDLNARPFRHRLANKVHEQIMKNVDNIIKNILKDFKDSQLKAIDTALYKLCRGNITLNCSYHELRVVCKRNSLIRAFGYQHGKMCVFVQDVEKDISEVQKYLSKNIDSAEEVEIRKYTKLKIKPIFVHQSGDKVEVPNMQSRRQNNSLRQRDTAVHSKKDTNQVVEVNNSSYASAALFLSDSQQRHYFVTCAHVIDGLKAHEVQVYSSNGTRHRSELILTPSATLDFSVVRILVEEMSKNEQIKDGVRNKNDVHIAGTLFERDSFIIPYGTEVFKWGATTGLTSGKYVGTIEEADDSDEDMEGDAQSDNDTRTFPYFCIKGIGDQTFAQPGDSGSLICFEWPDTTAAFILIGADCENPDSFIGNRLADGLLEARKIIPSFQHFLN